MRILLYLLLVAICAVQIVEPRKFFRGKLFQTPHKSDDPIDTELWFEQILDHFEPTNNALWKQVSVSLSITIK